MNSVVYYAITYIMFYKLYMLHLLGCNEYIIMLLLTNEKYLYIIVDVVF